MNKLLSKNVLGMKFMRRTKEQLKVEKTEKTFHEHFDSPLRKVPQKGLESDAHPVADNHNIPLAGAIVEVGSYSQCEGHLFGRQSFGGFNPVLEANVAKGIWKPVYLDGEGAVDSEVELSEEEASNDEKDVPDQEMAKTFGSLVGTIGKKFLKKCQRNKGKREPEESATNSKKTKKRNRNKSKNNSKGNVNEAEPEPPKKKRRFMKPQE